MSKFIAVVILCFSLATGSIATEYEYKWFIHPFAGRTFISVEWSVISYLEEMGKEGWVCVAVLNHDKWLYRREIKNAD